MITQEMKEKLLKEAVAGSEFAYCPYSNFRVGAAVLTKSGRVYTGGNIENVSYGATVCAERVAIWKAVSEGEKEFQAMAVVGPGNKEAYPCAQCRQVMVEFGLDWLVISGDSAGKYLGEKLVREIVPFPFTPDALLGRH